MSRRNFYFEMEGVLGINSTHIDELELGHVHTINVRGEPLFGVMVAGWFCENFGWIGKVEDVKPVL
jgi:hypothetical protein